MTQATETIDPKVAAAAAKAEKAAAAASLKAQKEALAVAAKAEKEAKAQKAAEKLANKMPEQNGIRRPSPNGECGKVWGFADAISAKLGSPAPIADVLEASTQNGVNSATTRTQYARWRAFHGIVGRIVRAVPAVPASPEVDQRHEAA